MEIIETVTREIETIAGLSYPVTITRRKGLQRYVENGKEVLIDEIMICDYGPKRGTTVCRTLHRAEAYTAEERAAGRAEIIAVATQSMFDQHIW
ncbi:MAG: hypothetical protein RR216_07040 [Pseudoflavonifractor sp.]